MLVVFQRIGSGLVKRMVKLLAEGFEALLTGDTSVNYQQNFSFRSISLIVLRAHNNKRKTPIEMMPEVNQVLLTIQPGAVIEVFHKEMKP